MTAGRAGTRIGGSARVLEAPIMAARSLADTPCRYKWIAHSASITGRAAEVTGPLARFGAYEEGREEHEPRRYPASLLFLPAV